MKKRGENKCTSLRGEFMVENKKMADQQDAYFGSVFTKVGSNKIPDMSVNTRFG